MTNATKTIMLVSDIQNKSDIKIAKVKNAEHFPDMFQKTDKGKMLIRRDLCLELTDGSCYWVVQTGQDGGKLIEKVNKYTEGKQKRTTFEQAISECKSKREKKYKKDKYREGRENAIDPEDAKYPPPMLATPKEKTKIVYPCFVQRKLDGNRCLARVTFDKSRELPKKVEMWSRSGNMFVGLPHIENMLAKLACMMYTDEKIAQTDEAKAFKSAGEIIFDGEMFSLQYNFQELNGVLKLHDLNPKDYAKDSEEYLKAISNRERKAKMQLWVYDIAVKGMPQFKRGEFLHMLMDAAEFPHGSIKTRAEQHPVVLEPYVKVTGSDDLNAFHARTVEDGFEGTIARMYDAGYLFDKRSKELVKIKDFHDAEYEVVGMVENDRLPGTGKFILKFRNTDGVEDTFDAMPMGSMQERAAMWDAYQKDPSTYVGKQMNVKYFELMPDGKPRFGVARVRDEH